MQKLNNKTLSIAFILFTSLLSCAVEGTIEDKKQIEETWTTYYSPTTMAEKDKLLSKEYKDAYLRHLDLSIRGNRNEINKLSFADKLNVLTRRIIIDSLNLSDDQLNTFEKAFNELETTDNFLISTDAGLSDIIFTDKEVAYGIFNMLITKKSNQFVKEEGQWKINPNKEHPKFNMSRALIKKKYIKEYGSENAAIEALIKLTTGQPVRWEPLRN